jgi:hypothetical protein
MKIVINSHINSTVALNHLLDSIKQNDYMSFPIIVVIGGHYELANYEFSIDAFFENILYIRANHNSIDFTGLIALLELFGNDINEYYLYLHDTCKIGRTFYNKLKSINLNNVSSIKINNNFSMNIGIYSQKIINRFRDFLLSKKNRDPNKEMMFKTVSNEDHIFNNDPTNIVLGNYNGWRYEGPFDYYGTGTMRIVEYYPYLDLYKIKANWGNGTWTLNN